MLVTRAMDELKLYMITKRRSSETIRGYRSDLTAFDRYLSEKVNGPVYVDDISTEDIENYLEMLDVEKSYAATSINRHLNSIRSFCQFTYRKGWMTVDCSKDIEQLKCEQKERTYLTQNEINILLPAIPHDIIREAVRTMAYTGLRASEITNLKIENVDFEEDLIYVIEGKGKKDRVVPIGQSLRPFLLNYLKNDRPQTSTDYFFATKKTGALSPQYINRVLRDTTKKLNWKKKVTCHTMRHSFASNLVSKDVNIVKISKLLGHADLKTTSIYTHSNTRELSLAVDLL